MEIFIDFLVPQSILEYMSIVYVPGKESQRRQDASFPHRCDLNEMCGEQRPGHSELVV